MLNFTQKEVPCMYVDKPPTPGCVAFRSEQI